MSEQFRQSKWARPFTPGRAFIRRRELMRRVPYSMVCIWRWEGRDEFPKRVQIGPNSVAWYEDEVDEWVETRIRGHGRGPGPNHYQTLTRNRRLGDNGGPPLDDVPPVVAATAHLIRRAPFTACDESAE